ncbi:MAG: HlyD family efflux transporter periplasmic adaptor subunit [Christensenellales bacterium]
MTGLYVEQGGVVTAGETTAQIIDMNSLEIELNVDEYEWRQSCRVRRCRSTCLRRM